MGTQVLYPPDYFIRPTPAPFSNRGNHYGYQTRAVTSKSFRKPVTPPESKKPVVASSYQSDTALVLKRSSTYDSVTVKNGGSAVENVTVILRRGKSLDSSLVAVKNDKYAGSAFAVSPSLPSFLTKKKSLATFDDSATQDLRRLLRIV
ncbi:hypothetical protein P8452_03853 [Trifolium repens]|nr:hypothetical protein P8452_03853 [Trifolium repens]